MELMPMDLFGLLAALRTFSMVPPLANIPWIDYTTIDLSFFDFSPKLTALLWLLGT